MASLPTLPPHSPRERSSTTPSLRAVLLAHLCDWVFQEEESHFSPRETNASALGASNTVGTPALATWPCHTAKPRRQPNPAGTRAWSGGGAARALNDAIARALLTAAHRIIAQQLGVSHGRTHLTRQTLAPLAQTHTPSDRRKESSVAGATTRGRLRSRLATASVRVVSRATEGMRNTPATRNYNQECTRQRREAEPAPLAWRNFPRTLPPRDFPSRLLSAGRRPRRPDSVAAPELRPRGTPQRHRLTTSGCSFHSVPVQLSKGVNEAPYLSARKKRRQQRRRAIETPEPSSPTCNSSPAAPAQR